MAHAFDQIINQSTDRKITTIAGGITNTPHHGMSPRMAKAMGIPMAKHLRKGAIFFLSFHRTSFTDSLGSSSALASQYILPLSLAANHFCLPKMAQIIKAKMTTVQMPPVATGHAEDSSDPISTSTPPLYAANRVATDIPEAPGISPRNKQPKAPQQPPSSFEFSNCGFLAVSIY